MKFVPKELKETADVSRGKGTWRSHLKNVVSVVVVLGLIYLALGLVANLVARTISESWEANLFTWDTSSKSSSDEFLRAKRIFTRLLNDAELRPLQYRLTYLDLEMPNAVALPGGAVGVTRGLLEEVESEIGLATVLGHELGHHQGRHCLQRLGRTLLFRGAIALLFGASETSLVESALGMAESSYSREQELEADTFGLRLVHKTYGHTEGSLEFFEVMMRETEGDGSPFRELFSSHPLTSDRLERLKKLARELEMGAAGE